MRSSGFLSDFHIPHLAAGVTQSVPMARARNESPPAPEVVSGNRLVAPGKQSGGNGSSDPGSMRPLKRKAGQTEVDSELTLFPGRDESYPEELNRLIGPLNCELCKVQMTSRKCARDHYESKAHDRHISAWLAKNYTEAGLQAPPVKRLSRQGPTGPSAFHCDLCDLDLTSAMHARQHYLGRKHKLVEQRISKPSGSGHYDSAGRWVRTGSRLEEEGAAHPSDGRHGIGALFLKPEGGSVGQDVPMEDVPPQRSPIKSEDKERTCSLCRIVVTSAPQMQVHLAGARHQKNMRSSAGPDQCGGDVRLPKAPPPPAPEKLDAAELAMYRTPIGQYYCKPCNMMMNHATTLQQHLIGKKHLKSVKALPQTDKTI
ncbi:zinc finger matrin-type protein 4 [Drosophila elegans]|uniref:zinc finger matrin-type protein 4 n=1 Tax=Drosophila elegans TaxID=30023 RepID=UPI0007E7C4B9|nr:zinc finger matrin-type protein 4 [Drosophila elegans]